MPSRAKIAALATVLALGGLAAVAFAAGSGGADPTAVQTQDDRPEVRTEVVRKTVHRRPKVRRAASPSGSPSGGGGAPAPAPAQPPAAAAPVASRSALAGDDRGRRHGGHGADDDGFDDHGGDDGFDTDSFDDDHADDFDDDSGGHGRGRGRGRGGDSDGD